METLAAIEAIESCVVGAIGRGRASDPYSLLFLLRLYQATGRDDIAGLLGERLAAAFDDERAGSALTNAAWLHLLVEICALSEDERVKDAVAGFITPLREAWSSASVEESAASIGACLHAASLEAHRSVLPPAIDELEALIGRVYHPGQGVGDFGGQVRTAATLLRAYDLTSRVPYAMLAEELILIGRRLFPPSGELAVRCESARVLCRLGALHDDPDYRRAAVTAADADYRREAAGMLAEHAGWTLNLGPATAIYGVALLELDSNAAIDDTRLKTETED
jgi:hypothetical protein